MMSIDEFKEEVQNASDFYLMDYFQPEIEFNFDDPEAPEAYITVKVRGSETPYILTLRLDESGDLGVECGEDTYLHADDGGFMTCLFFEAQERQESAEEVTRSAKNALESVKYRMDEHAYAELSNALNP